MRQRLTNTIQQKNILENNNNNNNNNEINNNSNNNNNSILTDNNPRFLTSRPIRNPSETYELIGLPLGLDSASNDIKEVIDSLGVNPKKLGLNVKKSKISNYPSLLSPEREFSGVVNNNEFQNNGKY